MGEQVVTKRTSGLVRSGAAQSTAYRGMGYFSRVQGWIIYKTQFQMDVDISIFWNGSVENTETVTVTLLPASDGGAAYWNGDFFWGTGDPDGSDGEAFWGGGTNRDVFRRADFDIAGAGEFFQWEVSIAALPEFQIDAIGFDLTEGTSPGY